MVHILGGNLPQTIEEISHFDTRAPINPNWLLRVQNGYRAHTDPFDEIPKWNRNLFNRVDDVAPYKYE